MTEHQIDWVSESTRYPDVAGHRNTDTSEAAAKDINERLGRLQALALTTIRAAGALGLTADELAAELEVSRWTIQPRTSELRRKGKIADSGQRRRNESTKSAIVWVAVEHLDESQRAAA
jgi:DNA-directed RNA polymerase specialized sigma24 family protein